MLFLHVFGAMTEERLGRIEFTLFYAVSAAIWRCWATALANADSAQSLVGASGAISAVLGAFLYLFPQGPRDEPPSPSSSFCRCASPRGSYCRSRWPSNGSRRARAAQGPGVAHLAHLVGFTLGFGYAWVRFRRKKGPEGAALEGRWWETGGRLE
ncbi:rhomboid family intramembrane serine protease [Streptomyces sp. L7]